MLGPAAGLPSSPPSRPRKASRALAPLSSRPNAGARLPAASEPAGRVREADGAASSIWPSAVALGSVSSWWTSGGTLGVRLRAAGVAGWAQLGEVSNWESRPPVAAAAGASEAIMSRLSARLLAE